MTTGTGKELITSDLDEGAVQELDRPAQSPRIDLSREIAEVMSQGPSGKAHQTFVHAKGVVCAGTFEGSPAPAAISRAAHFRPGTVPVVVRFSEGASDISVADIVELGIITITSVDPNSAEAERKLAFDPTRLVDASNYPATRCRRFARASTPIQWPGGSASEDAR